MVKLSRRSLIIGSAAVGLLPKSVRSEDNPLPSPPPSAESPKPRQLSAAQQLEHVAILLRMKDAQNHEYSGTGFFYNFFKDGDRSVTCIVTNRHAISRI